MKQITSLAIVASLCLLIPSGLSAQEAQERQRQGERPVAEPTLPGGGGGTTFGTAPDLSVFSVMKFAGTLKDSSGEPRTGTAGITFSFYSEQTGGAPLWLEIQNVQLDAQGRYTVLLGATKAEGLPVDLFFSGEARWLGIRVGTEAEQPRILLVSVPYALKAAEAETLGGRSADEFVTGEEFEQRIRQEVETQVEEALDVGGEGTREIDEAGIRSTFSDTNTTEVVFVDQQGTGIGLRAQSTSGSALVGESTDTTGATSGVQGIVNSADGVAGEFTNKASGKILSGVANTTEVFSVGGDGTVTASAFAGDGAGLTGVDAATLNGFSDAAFAAAAHGHTVGEVTGAATTGANFFTGDQGITGNEDVSGTVTAGAFVGDGSGLTNLAANSDLEALLLRIRLLEHLSPPATAGLFWANVIGGSGTDEGWSVTVDTVGDVFVTGLFRGTVDFGGGGLTSAGSSDIFLVKYDGVDGSHLWSKSFGGIGFDRGQGVAVDGNGDVFVTGLFKDTVDFGGGGLTSVDGSFNFFLVKLSGADGSHLWSKGFGGTGDTFGQSVAIDGNGDIVVTGLVQGTVDLDPGNPGGELTTAGSNDILLAKFSGADGSHLWSQSFGGAGNDRGWSVALDGSGNVVVTGQFLGTVDFGGGGLVSNGSIDIFLAKYSGADGLHLWSKNLGGTDKDRGFGVAVDPSGDVLVTGGFRESVDFGSGAFFTAGGGNPDVFVAKYSGVDGAHIWSKGFGHVNGIDRGLAVAADPSGNVVVIGQVQGIGFALDNIPVGKGGGQDILWAKFSGADGSTLSAKRLGSNLHDIGRGVAIDSFGELRFTGVVGKGAFGGGSIESGLDIFVVKVTQ